MNYWLDIRPDRRVTSDAVPDKSACDWCRKPAIRRCYVNGGRYHNENGLFCDPCSEEYAFQVERADGAANEERAATESWS